MWRVGEGAGEAPQRNKNQKVATDPSVRTMKAPPNKSIMSLSPILMRLGDNVPKIRN
jgi:hypothetical protein